MLLNPELNSFSKMHFFIAVKAQVTNSRIIRTLKLLIIFVFIPKTFLLEEQTERSFLKMKTVFQQNPSSNPTLLLSRQCGNCRQIPLVRLTDLIPRDLFQDTYVNRKCFQLLGSESLSMQCCVHFSGNYSHLFGLLAFQLSSILFCYLTDIRALLK